MESHYRPLIRLTEQLVPALLADQDRDPESRDYGGLVPVDRGYSEPGQSASAVPTFVSLICCPESQWFRSARLVARARLYCEHLLRAQHADGTMDLRETNFHDATMIGFSVQKLAYSYRLLVQLVDGPAAATRPAAAEPADVADAANLADLRAAVLTFLARGAAGMMAGGFHTPNHRWVMASGLALLAGVPTDAEPDRLRAEVELYLREGIDCTAAGEYTERSSGIYNVVNNRSLIIVAEELNRPELLEHVRRNLNMIINYIEPDWSIFTLNSRRQDAGRVTYPINYYENYLLMAHRDANPLYAGMADALLNLADGGYTAADGLGPVLAHYLLNPVLRRTTLPPAQPPTSYRFEHFAANIVRLRAGNAALALLAGQSVFLQFKVGALAVAAKIAGTFYGSQGRFVPAAIVKTDDGYRLSARTRWGYVRPLAEPAPAFEGAAASPSPWPATSEWAALPHERREQVMMGDFAVSSDVRFDGTAVDVHLSIDGVAGVLVKLELLVTAGGWLDTTELRVRGDAGSHAVLKAGGATYRLGHDGVRIEGGFAAHNSTTGMRGSDPPVADVFTIYCTGDTPLRRTLRLRAAGT